MPQYAEFTDATPPNVECGSCYTRHGRMLTALDDYNWKEAFEYATPERPLPGDGRGAVTSFKREDVVDIIAIREGTRDEESWLLLCQLADGRYGFLSANCDYTGWDCQAGGFAVASFHLERVLKYGMTREEAFQLGIALRRDAALMGEGEGF